MLNEWLNANNYNFAGGYSPSCLWSLRKWLKCQNQWIRSQYSDWIFSFSRHTAREVVFCCYFSFTEKRQFCSQFRLRKFSSSIHPYTTHLPTNHPSICYKTSCFSHLILVTESTPREHNVSASIKHIVPPNHSIRFIFKQDKEKWLTFIHFTSFISEDIFKDRGWKM